VIRGLAPQSDAAVEVLFGNRVGTSRNPFGAAAVHDAGLFSALIPPRSGGLTAGPCIRRHDIEPPKTRTAGLPPSARFGKTLQPDRRGGGHERSWGTGVGRSSRGTTTPRGQGRPGPSFRGYGRRPPRGAGVGEFEAGTGVRQKRCVRGPNSGLWEVFRPGVFRGGGGAPVHKFRIWARNGQWSRRPTPMGRSPPKSPGHRVSWSPRTPTSG